MSFKVVSTGIKFNSDGAVGKKLIATTLLGFELLDPILERTRMEIVLFKTDLLKLAMIKVS